MFGMSNIAWQLSKNPANSFGYTMSYCDVFGVCGMWGCILLWMDSGLCMG